MTRLVRPVLRSLSLFSFSNSVFRFLMVAHISCTRRTVTGLHVWQTFSMLSFRHAT